LRLKKLCKARAADVSDAAAADEGDVESAECANDKTIEFDPIFPDENTYLLTFFWIISRKQSGEGEKVIPTFAFSLLA
jgi:hypothetical protein